MSSAKPIPRCHTRRERIRRLRRLEDALVIYKTRLRFSLNYPAPSSPFWQHFGLPGLAGAGAPLRHLYTGMRMNAFRYPPMASVLIGHDARPESETYARIFDQLEGDL